MIYSSVAGANQHERSGPHLREAATEARAKEGREPRTKWKHSEGLEEGSRRTCGGPQDPTADAGDPHRTRTEEVGWERHGALRACAFAFAFRVNE